MSLLQLGTALWLGILTSISPCPLATNIAAISFVGKRVDKPWRVLLAGALYTLGRVAVYVGLGVLIVTAVLSKHGASTFLQAVMNRFLGPFLILVGMILLELLRFGLPSAISAEKAHKVAERGGMLGAAALGAIFALSFCPVSEGLFFGSLLTLCVASRSKVVLPTLFGVGTGMPVILFAFLIATSAHAAGRAFERLRQFEWWARRITGVVFIAVGIYLSLKYIFGVLG